MGRVNFVCLKQTKYLSQLNKVFLAKFAGGVKLDYTIIDRHDFLWVFTTQILSDSKKTWQNKLKRLFETQLKIVFRGFLV